MNWKVKAALQHAVSLLPRETSFEVYYRLQRTLGTLRSVNPIEGFENGLRLIGAIEAAGGTVRDKVFLEVGTGRRLNVPIALWLCGAARTITVDLNPYVKPRLILEDLAFMRGHADMVRELFGPRAGCEEFRRRFAVLIRAGLDVATLRDIACIEYVAPQDARKVPLADGAVDYQVSNNVLEHIQPDELRDILVEGKRVVRKDGLLVHRIDFSDHFSEVDARISTVNFLQYSETRWRWYAGSRYNYHNRLRIDELEAILAEAGVAIVGAHAEVDRKAVRLLESGFAVDRRFAGKPAEINATESAVMVLGAPVTLPVGDAVARVIDARTKMVT
jgi:SAM-dependent methyltransferase